MHTFSAAMHVWVDLDAAEDHNAFPRSRLCLTDAEQPLCIVIHNHYSMHCQDPNCLILCLHAHPQEVSRGQRALSYHAFAASALTMLAYLGQANGVDLYSQGNRSLSQLIIVVTT